jgi:hypothetical protein
VGLLARHPFRQRHTPPTEARTAGRHHSAVHWLQDTIEPLKCLLLIAYHEETDFSPGCRFQHAQHAGTTEEKKENETLFIKGDLTDYNDWTIMNKNFK